MEGQRGGRVVSNTKTCGSAKGQGSRSVDQPHEKVDVTTHTGRRIKGCGARAQGRGATSHGQSREEVDAATPTQN